MLMELQLVTTIEVDSLIIDSRKVERGHIVDRIDTTRPAPLVASVLLPPPRLPKVPVPPIAPRGHRLAPKIPLPPLLENITRGTRNIRRG